MIMPDNMGNQSIETERLIIRDMREKDTEDFFEIFSDPVAMKYFEMVFDYPRMEAWVQSNLEHQEKHGFSLMTVILKKDGEIIGDCGLETTDIDGRQVVGIGFDFKRKYWNRGYATEAALAVIDFGFKKFGFENLTAWIDPRNAPSQRVAEKIGMKPVKFVMRGGKKYALYSISNPGREPEQR